MFFMYSMEKIKKSPSLEEHNTSAFMRSSCKLGLITVLALTAIASTLLGSMTVLYAHGILPKAWSIFSFPEIGSGILLGCGGILLGGMVIYGLSKLVKRGKNEGALAHKRLSPGVSSQEGPSPKTSFHSSSEKPGSLLHAMSIFKNYDSSLADKYHKSAPSLSSFLLKVSEIYPSEGTAKKTLQQLAEIQKNLEDPSGDIELILSYYQTWLNSKEGSFHFFWVFQQEDLTEYRLVEFTGQSDSLHEDELRSGLKALQQFYVNGTPLPNDSFVSKLAASGVDKNNLAHLFHKFLGSSEKGQLNFCKLIYKANLLQNVLTEYPDWQDDPGFRSWVAASILHLKKVQAQLNKPEKSLKKEWKQAIEFLQTTENILLHLPPTTENISPFGKLEALQADKVERTPAISYPGVQIVGYQSTFEQQKNAVLERPINYPDYQDISSLELFNSWKNYFFQTYKLSNLKIETLESEIVQFLLHHPDGAALGTFLDTLTEEKKEEYAKQLYEISNLALSLHVCLGRTVLHPSRFLALIKTLDLLTSVVQTIKKCCFVGYTIDTSILRKSLIDPYFDLGSYQYKIHSILNNIEGKGKQTELFDMRDNHSEALMHAWFSNRDPKRYPTPEVYQNDWEGSRIPMPVMYLRYLSCFAYAFSKPHQTLGYNGNKLKRREDFKNHMEGLALVLAAGSKELLANRGLISINSKKEMIPFNISLKNDWYETDRYPLLDDLGSPMSPYYVYGGPIYNSEIRSRLAEGMIANCGHKIADQDGNFGCSVKSRDEDPGSHISIDGLKQTQFQVSQEKFCFPHASIEASRDLQKMASGRDNRASNALYTFSKHPYLLLQNEFGEDYRHVLRLHIFRSDLLIRELEQNCETAENVLSNFDVLLQYCEKAGDFKVWTFLYKAHADLISSLSWHPTLFDLRTKSHEDYTKKLLAWISQAEQDSSTLATSRSSLHLAFLYSKAVIGFDQNDLIELGKSLIIAQTAIENLFISSPMEGQPLYDLSIQLKELLIHEIEKQGMESLNKILAYRLKGTDQKWEKVARGVYKTSHLYLDLNILQATLNSRMEGSLPREIREDDSFKSIFGDEILKGIFTFSYVSTPLGKAWHVPLKKGDTEYHLYLRNTYPNFSLLFRKKKNQEWEQLIRIQSSSATLPIDFTQGFLWSSNPDSSTIEDPSGKVVYIPQFVSDRLIGAKRYINGSLETVLQANENALFRRLDKADGFVITESSSKAPLVTYLRGNAQYLWNETQKKWESTIHKGFFLSSKRVSTWVTSGLQKCDHSATDFFASSFRHYHLLENKEGKGKLITPVQQYLRSIKLENSDEVKYSLALEPRENKNSPWKKQPFAVFDLEANGLMKTKKPQHYLYLAYLLFVQGKYGDAMLYLQRSQASWTALDYEIKQERTKIKDWILQWNDQSPNGTAFKLKLLKMEHELQESMFASASDVLSIDAQFLPPLIKLWNEYSNQERQIDPHLRLSKQEKDDMQFLEKRKNTGNEQGLNEALDAEINFLEQFLPEKIERIDLSDSQFIPAPLFDISLWLTPLKESEAHQKIRQKVDALVSELNTIFSENQLSDEIGKELAKDISLYADKIEGSYTISQEAPLPSLLRLLQSQEDQLLSLEKEWRTRIVHQFQPPQLVHQASVERQLKGQEALFGELFETARHCFGLGNFSSLIEMGVIYSEQIQTLTNFICEYEIARTDRLLIGRKKESVKKLMLDSSNSVLRDDCAHILQEWRQYDPRQHPYSAILLLLEDELNITARKSQMKHIHKLIAHPDSYIHEAMAGGKTIFLRKLFSAIEQKKGRLAGVMTYAPLMGMHHKDYAETNTQGLGSTSYPLYYNRNAPHDATALKLMIIYHLKALTRNGRIDQTPQTALSLNHTLTEFVRILSKENKKTLEELTPAINALQKLLRLRGQYLSVYADEIDKIFDPMKDFNYSVGGGKILDKKFYGPALILVRLMMSEPTLNVHLEQIKKNPLYLQQMNQKEFESFLRTIAKAAYDDLKCPFDEVKTLDYLTEVHRQDTRHPEKQKEMTEFYKTVILTHSDENLVLKMQMLHTYIGVLFRDIKNKIIGADFGRSQDGISVKPFSFSAVCQENSQRSFVLSTILEICMDYLITGISTEGVKAYIEKKKALASQELKKETNLDTTPTGQLFESRFQIKLTEVKEQDLARIARLLQGSYPLLEDCLCEILLKDFIYFEDKIEGNAHHLSHLVGHFSGSSGSPERVNTLPGSIRKHKKLVRQSGAIGSVFYALLKDFDETKDIIELNGTVSVGQQLALHLENGDVFVDNAPFFPGKTGLEIVQAVANAKPQFLIFRFLDEQDDVCTWNHEHVKKGDEGINLEEAVSIISHKGRQGTNWTFATGKKGIVEAGVTTDMTSFYQSLMRLRLLGKGQKAKILYDTSLNQIWNQIEVLAGKSLLAKLIWTFIQNEDALVKHLHFQANRKAITTIRIQTIDTIKQSVENMEALALIKELEEFKLVEHSPLKPQHCGHPILLGDPRQVLSDVVLKEKIQLQGLKEKIQKLQIEQTIQNHCVKIIDTNLATLDNPFLVMEAKELPETVAANAFNLDAVEEIELEIQNIQENQIEVEQTVSLEVEIELHVESEMRTETEKNRSQKHPSTEEGREWNNYAISSRWWETALNGNENHERNGFIDSTSFPGILISNHALGIYRGTADASTPDGIQMRQARLWFYGVPEVESNISPKVEIVLTATGGMVCQLGSVKDSDFYFYESLNQKQIADQWSDMSFDKAKDAHNQVCKAQQEIISSALQMKDGKDGEAYYTAMNKHYIEFKQIHFFKIDLNETKIPDTLPKENQDKWIQTTALAKFIYVEGKFSIEEEEFLQKWLDNTCPISRAVLEKNLKDYLAKFYPNTRNNQLLRIIQKKKKS